MKERELPNKPKPGRLEMLFESLGREKQTVRKKELAGEIVREAAEEHEDCVPILLTLTNAFEMFMPGKKQDKTTGQLIIDGVGDYFQSHGICLKWLSEDDVSEEQFGRMLAKFSRNGSLADARGMRMSRGGKEFVFAINRAFENLSGQKHDAQAGKTTVISPPKEDENLSTSSMMVTIVANYSELEKNDSLLNYNNRVAEILRFSVAFINQSTGEIDRLTTPEKIWKIIQEGSWEPVEGLPVFLTVEYGGISLQSIISENDPDNAVSNLLSYIANMPKGNILWQYLMSGLFFATSYSGCDWKNKDQIQNPEFTRRIFSIQKLMTEKALLPAFSEEKDPVFDSLFGSALGNLNELSVKFLSFLIRSIATNGPETLSLFMAERPSGWNLINLCPLNTIAVNRILEVDPTLPILSDDATSRMLGKGLDSIVAGWKTRFPASEQRKDLELQFAILIKNLNAQEGQALHLSQIVRQELGEDFLSEFTKVEKSVGEFKMPSFKKTAWEGKTFKGEIDTESIGGKLGFVSIEFYTGDTTNDPTAFQLTAAEGWVVMGRINPEGKVDYLSADFGNECPGEKTLVEWIATGFFFALLFQQGMIDHIPFAVRSMIRYHGMEDKENGILHEVPLEDVEAEAAKISRAYGGRFNYTLLKKLNRGDMTAAIRRYPGGMHALREKISFQPEKKRITPEEINQKMSAILQFLEGEH